MNCPQFISIVLLFFTAVQEGHLVVKAKNIFAVYAYSIDTILFCVVAAVRLEISSLNNFTK